MSVTSIGDLAQTFLLQRRGTALKADIQRFGQELSSGQTADIAKHLGGTYGRLSTIEQGMRLQSGYRTTQAEVTQMTSVMQVALEQVRTVSGDLAQDLILSSQAHIIASQDANIAGARSTLDTVVAQLNEQSAGRSLFAGDATDQPALAQPADILSALNTAVAAETTAAGVISAVDAWFADPAGFAAVAYLGSTTGLAPLQLSDTASVTVEPRADSAEIKSLLRNIALAAVAGEPGFPLNSDETGKVLKDAGHALFAAQKDMISLQARLGFVEEQIATWSAKTDKEIVGLEYAKGALLAADPYEAATRLEQAQFQLESLYSVTVRLSGLSLVNFLR